jgi:mannose-6-phosphate isomerase class I
MNSPKETSVPRGESEAQALLRGDSAAALALAKKLLRPSNDNFVERPWAGRGMHEFKRLAPFSGAQAPRVGEAFEIAADEGDEEARRYPSTIRFADGSTVKLPELLARHADVLLGEAFVARHGKRWPLLPKTLDVAELLSVQAHPPGNTEVYVIIAAEQGATIRVGFKADVDPERFAARAADGRRAQQRLLELCAGNPDGGALQELLKPWLAARGGAIAALAPALRERLGERWGEAAGLLASLHEIYWEMLGLMNEIPVAAGDVIYNATPASVAAELGIARSAEVHALGNTEGREILALEIRKPGVTYRAWDNVRFPLRDIDVAAAVGALNLRGTDPREFVAAKLPVPGRPGVSRSVDGDDYRLEHIEPTALVSVDVPASQPHSLHVLAGAVTVYATDGALLGRLARGDSAIVPLGVGAYRVTADAEPAAVVRVETADRA